MTLFYFVNNLLRPLDFFGYCGSNELALYLLISGLRFSLHPTISEFLMIRLIKCLVLFDYSTWFGLVNGRNVMLLLWIDGVRIPLKDLASFLRCHLINGLFRLKAGLPALIIVYGHEWRDIPLVMVAIPSSFQLVMDVPLESLDDLRMKVIILFKVALRILFSMGILWISLINR